MSVDPRPRGKQELGDAVKKGLITAEEYELITGEPYAG
jgi:hypothetical protein